MFKNITGKAKAFYTFAVLGGLTTLLPFAANAQTVVTWSASDTDDVVTPSYTSWKAYIKWFLILAIPILIALYFLGRVLGIFQGRH